MSCPRAQDRVVERREQQITAAAGLKILTADPQLFLIIV
jgi:hypothetical protein